MDKRIVKLAKNIVNYSIKCQKGDKVLIKATDADEDYVIAFIDEVAKAGGIPFVEINSKKIDKEIIKNSTKESNELKAANDLAFMKQMDCYIGIRGEKNKFEFKDIPSDKLKINSIAFDEVVNYRVDNTKWVILNCPTPAFAQSCNMSSEQFEDFYFNVCCLDYSKMSKAMDNLVELMNKTDKVRLIAKDTDVSFSIKGIPAIKCDGEFNIPDGEVFTAPVKNSVNGKIHYNMPTTYQGTSFSDICLEIKDGKILNATSNNTEILNSILNTDEGARYFGEFAIGVNPYIRNACNDILFDEKMCGSIHFTPGCCYENQAPNGNISAIHWDMVLSQLPEFGGGEIYFDDVLIRKDGMFVLDELKCLNPENLL